MSVRRILSFHNAPLEKEVKVESDRGEIGIREFGRVCNTAVESGDRDSHEPLSGWDIRMMARWIIAPLLLFSVLVDADDGSVARPHKESGSSLAAGASEHLVSSYSPESEARTENGSDIVEIRELYRAWITAVESGDRDSYVSLLDENIRMIPPGAADVVGRDAYAEFLIPVFKNSEFSVTVLGDWDIEVLGDVALARYDYIIERRLRGDVGRSDSRGAPNQLGSNSNKYFDVLLRQRDGTWKVFRHMWNASVVGEGTE